MKKEICPCCDRKMFKLKNGQWTHLFSKAFEEAPKLEQKEIQLLKVPKLIMAILLISVFIAGYLVRCLI